jgi:sugar/nucleoside kinase (ribokinase family)
MPFDVVTVGVVCADVMVRPVDHWPERGHLQVVPELEMHLGGLASVTSTVLAQLGAQAACVGRVGNDGFGDYITETMRGQGVHVDTLLRDPEHNTSSTVVMISADGERTFLHHIGATAAVDPGDIDFELVKSSKVLHWGGPAITPGLDGAPIAEVMRRARELGVTTSMDTIHDGHGIWYPHIEPVLPHLDIVMSSLEEARFYTGKQSPEDIAEFYCSHGPGIALIKLGEEGIYLRTPESVHRLPAHEVPVADTTGAGDAACGGFLYGWVNGWDPLKCARLANAVGAITVQFMGGAEAITSLEETVALMEQQPCLEHS